MGRRIAVVVTSVTAGLAVLGCMGGNIFGANPGDGGCAFRPDGLIVDDITGVWAGNGRTFTLKLGGVITGKAYPVPPTVDASASPRSSASAARPPRTPATASAPAPRTPASAPRSQASAAPSPAEVDATGTWTLKPETYLGDIDITDVRSATGPASFGVGPLYVSGSRLEPWLYTFGDGDPDSCNIIKYQRTSRG